MPTSATRPHDRSRARFLRTCGVLGAGALLLPSVSLAATPTFAPADLPTWQRGALDATHRQMRAQLAEFGGDCVLADEALRPATYLVRNRERLEYLTAAGARITVYRRAGEARVRIG